MFSVYSDVWGDFSTFILKEKASDTKEFPRLLVNLTLRSGFVNVQFVVSTLYLFYST